MISGFANREEERGKWKLVFAQERKSGKNEATSHDRTLAECQYWWKKGGVRVDAFTSFYFETFTFCWRISRMWYFVTCWNVKIQSHPGSKGHIHSSFSLSSEKFKFVKYWFSVFCNVGRRPGGLCWIKWATLLLWRHNCDTRAVQTISHTSVIRCWPLAGHFESHSSLKRIFALHF